MKKSLLILLALTALFFGGCMKTQLFNWGNYSETLYAYKKNPSETTRTAHIKELNTIIANAATGYVVRKVPPGVYAELGFLYLQDNQFVNAKKCFDSEVALYPESKVLMTRLIDACTKGTK